MSSKKRIQKLLGVLRDHWLVIAVSVAASCVCRILPGSRIIGGIMAILGIIALAWLSGYRLSVGIKKNDQEKERRTHMRQDDYCGGPEDDYRGYQ